MSEFTKSSKPKVLYCGLSSIETDTIELISVSHIDQEIYCKYQPDLIITDEEVSSKCLWLYNSPYSVRKRWIYNKSELNYHSSAVYSNLTPNDKLISIFTSAYNTGLSIIDTYNSLKSQSYPDWEWVVTLDGTDTITKSILEIISLRDCRVKVYDINPKSNGCIGEAKFRAAKLCSGYILVELDHDDILTPDCLEWVIKGYDNPEVGFVYSDGVEFDVINNRSMTYGEGFAFGFGRHYEFKGYIPSAAPPINSLTIRHIISVPNHVRTWRSSVYNLIGGHNRQMRIADDYELIVRSFLHTKFMHIPRMLYIQRYNGNNSQNQSNNRADIQLRVAEIASFYDSQITDRLREFGLDDPCAGISAVNAYKSIDLTKLIPCNEILFESPNHIYRL